MRSESDSPSEGLLPQPSADSVRDEEKRRRWVSDLKTVAICVLLLSDLVALWYYFSTSLQLVKAPAPASTVSWTAAAVRAAEAAAMNSCSGHGSVFIDTVLVGSDGAQICECHECFTGPDCALLIPDCAVEADRLKPTLVAPLLLSLSARMLLFLLNPSQIFSLDNLVITEFKQTRLPHLRKTSYSLQKILVAL
jgi:hypothetical protein